MDNITMRIATDGGVKKKPRSFAALKFLYTTFGFTGEINSRAPISTT